MHLVSVCLCMSGVDTPHDISRLQRQVATWFPTQVSHSCTAMRSLHTYCNFHVLMSLKLRRPPSQSQMMLLLHLQAAQTGRPVAAS